MQEIYCSVPAESRLPVPLLFYICRCRQIALFGVGKYSVPAYSASVHVFRPEYKCRFANNVIFGDKAPKARIEREMAVVAHHKIVVHCESVALRRGAVYVDYVSFYFERIVLIIFDNSLVIAFNRIYRCMGNNSQLISMSLNLFQFFFSESASVDDDVVTTIHVRREIGLVPLLKRVRAAGGYIIHAHPFAEAPWIESIRLYPRLVDAVEIVNNGCDATVNARAAWYAAQYGLAATAGSDAHERDPVKENPCGVLLERPVDTIEELVNEIRAGRTRPFQRLDAPYTEKI